jgi:hypothetical protein
MKVKRFDIATVDDRIDILEAAFHPTYGNSSPSGTEDA